MERREPFLISVKDVSAAAVGACRPAVAIASKSAARPLLLVFFPHKQKYSASDDRSQRCHKRK
jgi:hypothetical protein